MFPAKPSTVFLLINPRHGTLQQCCLTLSHTPTFRHSFGLAQHLPLCKATGEIYKEFGLGHVSHICVEKLSI
jgi:hypothetical protein